MSKQNISNYAFSNDDRLFFDANIWMYIYGPFVNQDDRRSVTYATALQQIRNQKSSLFIDALVTYNYEPT